jgi:hypothetical protein
LGCRIDLHVRAGTHQSPFESDNILGQSLDLLGKLFPVDFLAALTLVAKRFIISGNDLVIQVLLYWRRV